MKNGKETFYFSHDFNARNDLKILQLRENFGWEGYGIYWVLIETMAESGKNKIDNNAITALSVSYNIDKNLLTEIINKCIEIQLFKSDKKHFWSESLLRRISKRKEEFLRRSTAGKKGMQSRWGDNSVITKNSNVITHSITVDNKKIKENKRKENKTINITFDIFWNNYQKKVGDKKSCEKKWNKLTDEEREFIIKYIPEYNKSTPDKKYRCNPETFFNQRRWESEIIESKPLPENKDYSEKPKPFNPAETAKKIINNNFNDIVCKSLTMKDVRDNYNNLIAERYKSRPNQAIELGNEVLKILSLEKNKKLFEEAIKNNQEKIKTEMEKL